MVLKKITKNLEIYRKANTSCGLDEELSLALMGICLKRGDDIVLFLCGNLYTMIKKKKDNFLLHIARV